MSSTKPEVHNVLHCSQRRTKPWPQVTRIENLVKFRHVVFEIYERTDTHTQRDRQTRGTCIHAVGDGDVALCVRERINGDEADQLLRRDVTQLADLTP